MDAHIEAVVFDFGNVLTLAPLEHDRETLRQLCGLERPDFDREYARQRREYDRGSIDGGRYWSRVVGSNGRAPGPQTVQALIDEDTAGWTRINESVLAWALELPDAGMRIGILSNMPRDILQRIRNRLSWLDRFEVKIFSCDLGVIKPEAQIYRSCLDAFQLEGSRILFLDDSAANVEGARRAGMRALQFHGLGDALRQIAGSRWLPPELTSGREEG